MPSQSEKTSLIFIYNANAGKINGLMDAAHKLLSPSTYACNLCAITYGAVAMKNQWRKFLDTLSIPVEFMYRDELKHFPEIYRMPVPVVFIRNGKTWEIIINSEEINATKSLADFIQLVDSRILRFLKSRKKPVSE